MRKQKLALVGVLAMSIVAATGCSTFSEKTSSPSDPSQGTNQTQPQENVMPTTVYVADQNGFVVPLQIQVAQTQEVAKATLENMVQGSAGDAALTGTGLHNILPKGTQIKGISLDKKGLATVNFSKEVNSYKTAQEEQDFVESVVWALTGLNNIKDVQFQVDGRILPTLAQGTPIGHPISRDSGINLQVDSGVNPSESTKLTLYFEGNAAGGNFSYLVPVTRIIPQAKNTDAVQLTMAELAKGPNVDGLTPVMKPTLKPLNTALKNKVATLNFGSDFQATDGTAQEKDMIDSIALSLAANTGAEQVQFTVNGKALTASKDLNLSQPVSVPKVINSEKL